MEYTVIDTWHYTPTSSPYSEAAVFLIEDESGDRFQVEIPKYIVDNIMTNQQITDFIQSSCSWHSQKFIAKTMSVKDKDSALETRMAGFVNNTFTV